MTWRHVDIMGFFTPERGVSIHSHYGRQDVTLARGHATGRYNSRNGLANVHDGMDRSVRSPRNIDVRRWHTVHVEGVEVGFGEIGNSGFHHNVLPSTGEWDGGTVSPRPEGFPPMSHPVQQVMDQITAMGSAWFAKCA